MAWVLVGLGNPGEEYQRTRHNTGRMALEFFAKSRGFSEWKADKKNKATVTKGSLGKNVLALVAPDTFMNKSGSAVSKYVKSQKLAERMIVVYDDLDLPVGKIKLSYDRGSGGHKGLESIMRAVRTKKFTRVRIGVSPHTPGGKLKKPSGEKEVNNFILGTFSSADQELLKRVFKHASDALEAIITEGWAVAMNRFN